MRFVGDVIAKEVMHQQRTQEEDRFDIGPRRKISTSDAGEDFVKLLLLLAILRQLFANPRQCA